MLEKNSVWLQSKLKAFDAVITNDHLVLTSGNHSDSYVNLRVLEGNVKVLSGIGKLIAAAIEDREKRIEDAEIEPVIPTSDYVNNVVIVGPETMGRTLATFTAAVCDFDNYAWCQMKTEFITEESTALWSPKVDFARLINGARCYIVDDLLTTSKSINMVKKLIEETGGKVEGVVVAVKRSQDITAESIGVPWLYSLLEIDGFASYNANSCPLCKAKVPMRARPGHGHEWLKTHQDYPSL
jgi:orotate phosphoribosyltransferase